MTTAPVAGWYPDPAGGSGERWWDGERWTENTTVRAENAFILPPPPPAVPAVSVPAVSASAAPARAASSALPERGRDRSWIADAASAGAASASRASALSSGAVDALDQARAVLDAYGHVQTTGPQPSFGGYVAIRPSRTRPVVLGVTVTLGALALVAAGLVAYQLWAAPQLGLPAVPGLARLGLAVAQR